MFLVSDKTITFTQPSNYIYTNTNKDLETMVNGFVGRELRIIELKKKVDELEKNIS